MSWNMIWGMIAGLKHMTYAEKRLFFEEKGTILFKTYHGGRINYQRPIGFETKGKRRLFNDTSIQMQSLS
jgi:hypothetical protein